MSTSAAYAEHSCEDGSSHLNAGDIPSYVTTWWLFHYHEELVFHALRTTFLLDFDRYLVRHPTYATWQARLLSDLPFTPSYLSPFKSLCARSKRSTKADRADKGRNSSFVSATVFHMGKRRVKLWQIFISHTRQETVVWYFLLLGQTCMWPCVLS